jgi:hypothetical protein
MNRLSVSNDGAEKAEHQQRTKTDKGSANFHSKTVLQALDRASALDRG